MGGSRQSFPLGPYRGLLLGLCASAWGYRGFDDADGQSLHRADDGLEEPV